MALSETAVSPRLYLAEQTRWRPAEIVFWLATLTPYPCSRLTFRSCRESDRHHCAVCLIARPDPRLCRHRFSGTCGILRDRCIHRGTVDEIRLGRAVERHRYRRFRPGIVGYATSFVICRFRHLALIMLTLGFGLLLAELANTLGWVTGGMDGLQGIHTWKLLGTFPFDLYGRAAYAYALAVLFILFLFARRLIHSPFGLSLRGIRENFVRMPATARQAVRTSARSTPSPPVLPASPAPCSRKPPKPYRLICWG